MSRITIPKGYKSILSSYQTQTAIGLLKRKFEDELSKALNVKRVSAPLFVETSTGLNDDLSGQERAVEFDIPETGTNAQVVHSLAKWKRMALKKYGFPVGEGLYTDMNAIRRDEEMDNIHSIYVDQWDWERVITKEERNLDFLKDIVQRIVDAICDTHDYIKSIFPSLSMTIKRQVSFVTSEELVELYGARATAKEREYLYLKEHKTAFIMQIGDILKCGSKHDGRAPDYDDWKLNGDIMFYNEILDCAFEISSMGIRVDAKSLEEQLIKANCIERKRFEFHRALLNNELPLCIGGGIGQSRTCMLLLEKAHVGEVQVSVWDNKTIEACKENDINLL